jgi:hypothetical protein
MGYQETITEVCKHFNLTSYELDNRKHLPLEIPNFNREDLALLFGKLGFKAGVEIGVESGAYSEILMKQGINLIGVDPWKSYRGYRDHVNQDKMNTFYENAKKVYENYPGSRIIRKFSADAVREFEDRSLDFAYVDGNHAIKYVIEDLVEWSTKVRSGGIVAGHDYIRRQNIRDTVHVVPAVHCFVDCYRIPVWFILGNQAKNDGLKRDDTRSFMWVQQ